MAEVIVSFFEVRETQRGQDGKLVLTNYRVS